MIDNLYELNSQISEMNTGEILEHLSTHFENKCAFSTSLGAEDQVLTDMIYRNCLQKNKHVQIFTLDTGRLHPETYHTLEKTNSRYNLKIKVYFPQAEQIEALVNRKGLFSFYESVEERKRCCAIRKLEPLARALKGMKLWITGLRRSQSQSREKIQLIEWDEAHEIFKCNPLLHWSHEEVWKYIRQYKLPYNALHDQGFPSIGCAPCTRAVKDGDDLRSGRWWWENSSNKECGLHPA